MSSAKSRLNELTQQWGTSATYELVSRIGPVHKPAFVMRCTVNGVEFDSPPGRSKQAAEQAAAAAALRYLEDLDEVLQPKLDRIPDAAFETCDPREPLHQTVLVDVENVPEFPKYLERARRARTVRLFVSPHAHASGLVHRARTTLRDANDLQLIMWAARAAPQLADNEELLIASRDHLFETFVAELRHPRVRLVRDVTEL
jgi:hypothetical protein